MTISTLQRFDDVRRLLKNTVGKHIKQTLQRLESLDLLKNDARKVILDEYNDLHRDLLKDFGLAEEDQ